MGASGPAEQVSRYTQDSPPGTFLQTHLKGLVSMLAYHILPLTLASLTLEANGLATGEQSLNISAYSFSQ